MESMYLGRAFIMIVLVSQVISVRTSDLKSPASSGRDSDGCKPVVQAGKEVPQMTTYRVDDKRSYGKPGNESNLVQRKHCDIDAKKSPSVFPGQPHDCADIQASGVNVSGVYGIFPGRPFNVYCDMATDGGGWTVFQRRMDGSVDFSRNWADYQNGFGRISSEHWLGNEKIHQLTSQKSYELRVDLEDYKRKTYANYKHFDLGNETSNYKLFISDDYRGNAGDGLVYLSGNRFSTRDRDNDKSSVNCANVYKGGWWFHNCYTTYLNGVYRQSTSAQVVWQSLSGARYRLIFTEMKIRPVTMPG